MVPASLNHLYRKKENRDGLVRKRRFQNIHAWKLQCLRAAGNYLATNKIILRLLGAQRYGSARIIRSTSQAGSFLAGSRHIFCVTAAVLVDAVGREFKHAIG